MGEPARRLATYDDVLAAPDGWTAEILAGELHLSPRPAMRHMWIETQMSHDLVGGFGRQRGPGGWILLAEPELHLGVDDPRDTVAVPDLAGWRRERVAPGALTSELRPDCVCEILSPGSANIRRDRLLKPDLYASRGVPHLWLVDPDAQLLEVWRLQGAVYARIQAFAGPVAVRAEPFDAVELDMAAWWPDEPAP